MFIKLAGVKEILSVDVQFNDSAIEGDWHCVFYTVENYVESYLCTPSVC